MQISAHLPTSVMCSHNHTLLLNSEQTCYQTGITCHLHAVLHMTNRLSSKNQYKQSSGFHSLQVIHQHIHNCLYKRRMPNIGAHYLASRFHIQEALSLNFCQHVGYSDEVFCYFLQSLQGLYTKMCHSLFLPQSSKVIKYHDSVIKLCITHTGDKVSLNRQRNNSSRHLQNNKCFLSEHS